MRKLLPYGARAFLCFLLVGMSSWMYAGSPLSGAYTINPANPASSTNFTSFTMAADSLTTNGVSGAVTITVSAGTYNEYMTLTSIAGVSSTNTVTINGGDTATTSIVHDGTTQEAVIAIDGAQWVTVTNLKIVNSRSISDAWGVRISNESDNFTLSNCLIEMAVVSSFQDIVGVLANGSTTASFTEGTFGDNITINNNVIRDGYYGMRIESLSWNDTNLTVTNNWMNGNIGYGMYNDNLVGLTLTANKVDGASLTSKDGFYNFDLIDFNIQENKTDVPDWGLYISDGNFDLTLPATRSKIINNMFGSTGDEGLYIDDFQQCDIFHNTFAARSTSTSAYGAYMNDLDDVVIKNNIFYSGATYAFYSVDDLSASATVSYDYNVYYTGGTTLAYVSFSNQYADLAAWQAADATNNVSSVEGDPVFGAGNDLHVSGSVANDVGDNSVGITTDIDGDTRPLAPSTTVDIGADEFAAATCQQPSALGAYNETTSGADVYWTTGGAMNWNIQYGTSGFSLGSGTIINATNDTTTLTGLSSATTYEFYVRDSCGATDLSGWAGPFSFTTLCAPFTAPYTESFDGTTLPNCYALSATSGGPWLFTGNANSVNCAAPGDHTGNAGSYAWMDQSGSDGDVVMEMGEVDVTSLTTPYLEFYYAMCGAGYSPPNMTIVQTWDGSAWSHLDTITAATSGWEAQGYNLTGRTYGANLVKVRFIAVSGGSGSDFFGDNSIDDISIKEAPSCAIPSSLGVVSLTDSSATIHWTTGGASNWNVEYGASGFTQGTGTIVAATNDTITITGLMANTAYQFYVQDSCGAGDVSAYVGPSSFTTNCATFAAPFSESFDAAGIPACWSAYTPTGSGTTFSVSTFASWGTPSTDHTGNGGNYAWVDDSSPDNSDNTLESPMIDVSTLTVPQLSFFYWSKDNTVKMQVDVWDGTTWLTKALEDTVGTGGAWQEMFVDLPMGVVTQIRFIVDENNASCCGNDVAFDDITIGEKPSCADPTNLGSFGIAANSASVGWLGSGNSWEVEYGLGGYTQGTGTSMASANDTITLTGLTDGTPYDVYVREICGAGDTSAWVGPVSFNTLCAAQMLPYSESFDAGFGCFTAIDGGAGTGDTWAHTINATQNLDGTGYIRVDSDANGNGTHLIETAESPIIDASTVNNQLLIEFDHYFRSIIGDSATVQVYDGTTWVNLAVYKSSTGAWGAPVHEVLDATAYANANFQVRFHYDDNNGWNWYWSVDNFLVHDACTKRSLPYTENFDTDMGCFTAIDGGGATGDSWMWTAAGFSNLDGTGYIRVDSDANGNGTHLIETAESPQIDASGITGTLLLEFDHYFRSILGDSATVQVWDGTVWQNVAIFKSSIGAFGTPDHQMIDITAYANADLQVRFHYDDNNGWNWYWNIDNFSVAEVGCLQPSALGAFNITQTGADVFWTSGGATDWIIQFDTTGFALGTGTTMVAGNDTMTLTGLMPATTYDFYVLDSCGAGNVSNYAGPFSFTTLCSTFPAPFTESFDATTMPNCWSQSAGLGGPWLFAGSNNSVNCAAATDHTGNGGSYTWMDQSSADDSVSLVTPQIDVSTLTVPYLEFYYWMCGVGYTPINLTIIETWDGVNWDVLDTLDIATNGWEVQGYDLTGRTFGANLVQVRFRAESGGSGSDFFGDNALDDISVIEKPSCPDPTALGSFNITGTSADIFWTPGGASNWNIEYGPVGFAPGTGTSMAVTNDTVSLTGLTPGTGYDFYVQDSCGMGDVSAWVGPHTFVTPVTCPPVESLPFHENFDLSEGCFDTIDGGAASGDGWEHTINATQNLDGTGHMRVDSDANGNGTHLIETLESPVIDASVVNNSLVLEFDHFYRVIGADSGTVDVFDGTNWVTVASYNSTVGAFGAPVREVIDVTAYANANFQVRFHYDDANSWAWYWLVDNFSVEDKCVTQSLPYVENFDVDAGCFTTVDAGGATGDTWAHTINATQNLDGTGYMRVDSDANGNGTHLIETLVSPVIDASSVTGTLMLDFDHYYRSILGDSGTVEVYDGTAWVTLVTFTSNTGAWGAPDQQSIDITAYANANLQVRFHYDDNNGWNWYWSVDNFSVAEVGCVAPSALGVDANSITQNAADIFWTTGGAANWNVEWGPQGFTPGSGTFMMATNDTVSLTGLMAATCYDFYVQDSCGAGDVSTWTGPFTFCTACGPFMAPYTESFDGTSTPLCWTEYSVFGGPWLYSTGLNSVNCPGAPDHTGNGGNYAWMDQSGTDTLVTLEMNEVDVSSLTTPYLEFYYWMCGVGYTPTNITIIETWDGTNWNLLDTLDHATSGWERQGYSLAGLTYGANLVKVRFTAESGRSGSDFFGDNGLDDVSIIEEPACLNPTGFMVTGQTTTSISLAWNADTNIISSNIQYGAPGFALGSGTNVSSATPGSMMVTGLTPGTCYEFYVQDSCSALTAWVGPILGCTGSICSVTTMPTATGDSANCGGGPITLTGTPGSGDIAWLLNGTVLGTGNSYSDSIGGTTVYHAHDYATVAPAVNIGPLTSIAGAGFGNFSNGQWFTVMDTISIDSCTVRANGFVEASVIILDDAGGNLVQIGDTFTTDTTTGDYQVPINVVLTPGNYFMGIDYHTPTTGQLFRATSGAVYPYLIPGLMSIDSVNFPGARYYYTFDLIVSPACLGPGVPVTGFVPGPNAGTGDTVNVCETDTAVNLAGFLGPHDAGGNWVDVDLSMALTDSIFNASLADTGSYYNFDYILPPSGGCTFGDTATITVFVDFQRNPGMNGADTLCTDVTALVSLNQYLGSHTGGGSWTDLDTSGALFGIRVRPSSVNAPGTYRYQYTVASNGACPGGTSIVTITYEDPVSAGIDASDTICDSASVVDLTTYLDATASAGGSWIDADGSGALTGSNLDPSAATAGSWYNFVYVVTSAGCGNDSATVSIYIKDCGIGLDEQGVKQFNVYPNPTTGVFFIESLGVEAKGMEVEVYSVNGQLMMTKIFNGYNTSNAVDLADLAKGVYNVKVITEYGVEVHRITRH